MLKNASVGVAKVFTDITLNKKHQCNHIGTFLHLIQVKVVLFCVISATSYCCFLGSTPFKMVVLVQQLKYAMQKYRCTWTLASVSNEEVCGINIP